MKVIKANGAEASIYFVDNKYVLKDRLRKSYRYVILDEKLRRQRTKKEIRLLKKALNVILVPKVISSDQYRINLELINGNKLSDIIDSLPSKKLSLISEQIGNSIAKLHDFNIIHGDLTTSNMILKKDKLYFIDFGLGFESNKLEDKAVDLHLIKEALVAKHFKDFDLIYSGILKGYKVSKNFNEVLSRLEKVDRRGRYKEQF